jgi:uncharacterized protein (TIGR00369 family)
MENTEENSPPPTGTRGLLDIQVIETGNGRSILRLNVERKHVHSDADPRVGGGVILSLADAAAHHAMASLLEKDELHATVEVKLNFISPGRLGVLEAEGVILHKGGRISVSEVTIRQEGRIVAKAQGTETTVIRRRE